MLDSSDENTLDERVSSFQVSRHHAHNLGVNIGETIFSDAYHAIGELVSNSHDAGAHLVEINLDPTAESPLTVSDDGRGMNREGVAGFFQIGGSEKRDMKKNGEKTPEGRVPIGNFGWGSLAVRYLAQTHRLETWNKGMHFLVEERFSEDDKDDDPIRVQQQEVDFSKRGTKVSLGDLRFTPGKELAIDKLMVKLADSMPIEELDDFEIRVNGKMVTPLSLKGAVEYFVRYEDPEVGTVTGSIFYSKKSLGKRAGILTKVNGRGVGGLNERYLSGLQAGIRTRIRGSFNVSGMDDLIIFNRGGFKTSEASLRLDNAIKSALKQIRQDQEEGDERKADQRSVAKGVVMGVLPKLGDDLKTTFREATPYKFSFDPTKSGDVLFVDRRARTVYVNPSSPVFRLRSYATKDVQDVLFRMVQHAAGSAMIDRSQDRTRFDLLAQEMADERFKGKRSKRTPLLSEILEAKKTLGRTVYDPNLRIVPIRLYQSVEATNRTGWVKKQLQRMKGSGVISTIKDKYLGQDLIDVKKRLEGYVTLYDAIRRIETGATTDLAKSQAWYNREMKIIRRLRSRRHPDNPEWMENFGSGLGEKDSFYVIPEERMGDFEEFLARIEGAEVRVPVQRGNTRRKHGKPRLTDHRFAYCRPGDTDALIYVAQVRGNIRKDASSFADVRPVLDEEISFAKDLAREVGFGRKKNHGIKGASYLVEHQGELYVFGIFTGKPAASMAILKGEFVDEEFDQIERGLGRTFVSTIGNWQDEVTNQNRLYNPMATTRDFEGRFPGLIEVMVDNYSPT